MNFSAMMESEMDFAESFSGNWGLCAAGAAWGAGRKHPVQECAPAVLYPLSSSQGFKRLFCLVFSFAWSVFIPFHEFRRD